jgi:hypothetical protein
MNRKGAQRAHLLWPKCIRAARPRTQLQLINQSIHHLVLRLGMSGAIPLHPLYSFVSYPGKALLLLKKEGTACSGIQGNGDNTEL